MDAKRGIVYFPLGSPTYDSYAADRIGAGLFGDCLLALDARTGKRLWRPARARQSLGLRSRHSAEASDRAPRWQAGGHRGTATKFGFLYVFNGVTGEPLWPIEEQPVPKRDVPGEQSLAHAAVSHQTPPFARQIFTVEDISHYVDAAEKARLPRSSPRNEVMFTPATSTRNQISVPGELGRQPLGRQRG